MASMHTHSPPSATACGGIGDIIPTDGEAILTTVGDGTVGTAQAGVSAGAAGTAVAGGVIIIITTIPTMAGTEAIGATDTEVIGGMALIGPTPIQTDARSEVRVETESRLMEEALPPDARHT